MKSISGAGLRAKGEKSKVDKKNKAVFLDRDGVVNEDLDFVHKMEDFKLIPGALEALQKLSILMY